MKNYKVKAIMKFTDKEENTKRIVNDEFFCTKERYDFLKSNGAVILVEVVEEKEEIIKEKNIDSSYEEDLQIDKDELVEKPSEEKPKKKKHSKK